MSFENCGMIFKAGSVLENSWAGLYEKKIRVCFLGGQCNCRKEKGGSGLWIRYRGT